MMESPDSRKNIALDFIKLCAAGNAKIAFPKHAAHNFKHHNAYFKGDAATLMHAMDQSALENPNKVFQVLRALEDGELVAIHSFIQQNSSEKGAVVMHIFRFEGEKIVELWDFAQAIPAEMINENGML